MTETSILPGAPTTDDGVSVPPPDSDTTETAGGDRRRLMIAGGVAGVVVLAAAAFLLLHGGSSPAPSGAVPRGTPQSAAPAPASHTGSGKAKSGHGASTGASGPTTLPKVAKHINPRDPFKPLVLGSTGGGTQVSTTTVTNTGTSTTTSSGTGTSTNPGGTTTGTGTGTGTNPGGTTTGTGTGTNPGGTTTGTGTGTGGGKSTGGQPKWIQLMTVKGNEATFDVGYAHHKFRKFNVEAPKPGDRVATVFDKEFALVSIQGNTATVQVGDSTPFLLAPGIAHVV